MNKQDLNIKLYIGPMSKNIVLCVIDYCNEKNINIGFIPSRRQIDYKSGYVNNWTTEVWANYVRSKTNLMVLERDHGSINQGDEKDDGKDSLKVDSGILDIIHIDVWKQYTKITEAAKATIDYIDFCYEINPNILFEVGTEEAIHNMSPIYFGRFLNKIFKSLPPHITDRIIYAVVQPGTKLLQNMNIGVSNQDKLKEMIRIAHSFGLKTKCHNGDYLPTELYHEYYNLGIDAINIAPEFGMMESLVLLEVLNSNEINILFQECLKSERWRKWVSKDFDPYKDKTELIKICGHYVLSNNKIKQITNNYKEIYLILKEQVYNKINNILNI